MHESYIGKPLLQLSYTSAMLKYANKKKRHLNLYGVLGYVYDDNSAHIDIMEITVEGDETCRHM
jgi:hypothetical protein